MKKKIESFEDLKVYQLAKELGDQVGDIVIEWLTFAKSSLGYQLVKAADSIGANLAEGFGRFHFAENKQFARISRGSLYETRHWVRRAYKRGLIKQNETKGIRELVDELAPRLNAYIRSLGKRSIEMTNDSERSERNDE
ncbi:MAG: four helix bundle protein [Deltaproteobacteria bacterium]|nr:MAG: four helix bundle protein [Deltaproteobacteria bacterium]